MTVATKSGSICASNNEEAHGNADDHASGLTTAAKNGAAIADCVNQYASESTDEKTVMTRVEPMMHSTQPTCRTSLVQNLSVSMIIVNRQS